MAVNPEQPLYTEDQLHFAARQWRNPVFNSKAAMVVKVTSRSPLTPGTNVVVIACDETGIWWEYHGAADRYLYASDICDRLRTKLGRHVYAELDVNSGAMTRADRTGLKSTKYIRQVDTALSYLIHVDTIRIPAELEHFHRELAVCAGVTKAYKIVDEYNAVGRHGTCAIATGLYLSEELS